MYIIRSLTNPQRLEVAVSGQLDERESQRMVSQVGALAEADGSQYVLCDIAAMVGAFPDIYPLAAALAAMRAPVFRVAVVAPQSRDERVRAIARASGAIHAVRIFREHEAAMAWLNHSADAARRSATAIRHASSPGPLARSDSRRGRLRAVPGGITAA